MVELNVALENVCAKAQHALKSVSHKMRNDKLTQNDLKISRREFLSPCPVEFDTFERSFGYDGGSTRPIQQ